MSIVENRKAFHDYFIEERFEAGLALEGWEVKSIRAGRANLKEAYVVIKNGEIVLIGAHMSPLSTASTHVRPDPTRTRKLRRGFLEEKYQAIVAALYQEKADPLRLDTQITYADGRAVKIQADLRVMEV